MINKNNEIIEWDEINNGMLNIITKTYPKPNKNNKTTKPNIQTQNRETLTNLNYNIFKHTKNIHTNDNNLLKFETVQNWRQILAYKHNLPQKILTRKP